MLKLSLKLVLIIELMRRKKPTEYKLIESIYDVLTMIEDAEDDKRVIVNLILKGDDLTGLLYELKEHGGYEPQITYQAGKITFISVKLDKTLFFLLELNNSYLIPLMGNVRLVQKQFIII